MQKPKREDLPLTIPAGKITSVASAQRAASESRHKQLMKQVQLHKVLATLMKDRGVTARALSKETKIPASTITSYVGGKKASYAPEHLASLCDYFGVTSDFLLFGEATGSGNLGELQFQDLFEGLVRIRIEKVIPPKKAGGGK